MTDGMSILSALLREIMDPPSILDRAHIQTGDHYAIAKEVFELIQLRTKESAARAGSEDAHHPPCEECVTNVAMIVTMMGFVHGKANGHNDAWIRYVSNKLLMKAEAIDGILSADATKLDWLADKLIKEPVSEG